MWEVSLKNKNERDFQAFKYGTSFVCAPFIILDYLQALTPKKPHNTL